jgi:hypothetical protein
MLTADFKNPFRRFETLQGDAIPMKTDTRRWPGEKASLKVDEIIQCVNGTTVKDDRARPKPLESFLAVQPFTLTVGGMR